jgi:hypothetical protein
MLPMGSISNATHVSHLPSRRERQVAPGTTVVDGQRRRPKLHGTLQTGVLNRV